MPTAKGMGSIMRRQVPSCTGKIARAVAVTVTVLLCGALLVGISVARPAPAKASPAAKAAPVTAAAHAVQAAKSARADKAATCANPVACENQLPGTPPSVWDVGASEGSTIQGFADPFSVN